MRLLKIFHNGRRVASHARAHRKGQYVTDPSHRPASHRAHAEWTPSRLIRWGEAAVSRALTIGTLSMHSVKSILKHSLDQTTLPLFEPEEQPTTAHENLRGAGCYQDATTTKRGLVH